MVEGAFGRIEIAIGEAMLSFGVAVFAGVVIGLNVVVSFRQSTDAVRSAEWRLANVFIIFIIADLGPAVIVRVFSRVGISLSSRFGS